MNQPIPYWFKRLLVATAVVLAGCGKEAGTNMTVSSMDPVTARGLQIVSKKKIFFGHQSVGYDIVQGIGDVMKENPAAAWKIVESADPGVFAAPLLAHARVGKNSDPESKVREFAERVRAGIGDRADVASFKFCYADFERTTDAAAVFAMYKGALADLSKAYPKTRFVHITVPLKATSSGWKKQIKTLLGRPHPFIADNVRRSEFNELMRAEYKDRQPFFDLAAIESTRPDGSASFDKSGGKSVPSLVNEYTYDSGHLNEHGRKFVAARFLALLASL